MGRWRSVTDPPRCGICDETFVGPPDTSPPPISSVRTIARGAKLGTTLMKNESILDCAIKECPGKYRAVGGFSVTNHNSGVKYAYWLAVPPQMPDLEGCLEGLRLSRYVNATIEHENRHAVAYVGQINLGNSKLREQAAMRDEFSNSDLYETFIFDLNVETFRAYEAEHARQQSHVDFEIEFADIECREGRLE